MLWQKWQKKSNCKQSMRSQAEWHLCQVSWKFVKWFYKSLPGRNTWTDELTNRHNTVKVFPLWEKERSTKEHSLVKFCKLLKFCTQWQYQILQPKSWGQNDSVGAASGWIPTVRLKRNYTCRNSVVYVLNWTSRRGDVWWIGCIS